MSGRQSHRRRVSPTLLTLQPLEPRCLMAADAGFAASLAAGPRLAVAQAEAEATAGSQAAEQAVIRREVTLAAAVVDPRRMTDAVGQLMVHGPLPGGVTTSPIATETVGSDAVPKHQTAGQAAAGRRSFAGFDPAPRCGVAVPTGRLSVAMNEVGCEHIRLESAASSPDQLNRRKFDHIGNFNFSIRPFGVDYSETSNI